MPKIRHGLWIAPKRIDGRLRISKAMAEARGSLITALGGDVSPQEEILIDRSVFLLYKVMTFESQMLKNDTTMPSVHEHYLGWVNTLRKILETLGLKRIPKELDLEKLLDEETDKPA